MTRSACRIGWGWRCSPFIIGFLTRPRPPRRKEQRRNRPRESHSKLMVVHSGRLRAAFLFVTTTPQLPHRRCHAEHLWTHGIPHAGTLWFESTGVEFWHRHVWWGKRFFSCLGCERCRRGDSAGG